jgi:dihydroorotate dehydrogenase
MHETIDLSVRMGDVVFKNPFIVGSGPTVKNADQIRMAQDNGWAGASLKLAIDPFPYLNLPPRYRWLRKQKYHIFTAEKRLTAREALNVVEEARRFTQDFVLIPTITYDGEDYAGWGRLAKSFEDAGAHVIELNMCCPNMSFNLANTGAVTTKNTGASLGNDMENLPKAVAAVVSAVSIPVIVKFSPEGNMVAQAAHLALQAGAAGVGHAGNRLGIPEIDIRNPGVSIYRLQDEITLGCMSGPWLRPLALRDTYQMRLALGKDAFIIGSGGVADLDSAVQQIMVGSDAVWICTETMLRGFDFLPKLLDGLKTYMRDMGYTRIHDFRDILHRTVKSAADLTIRQGYAVVDHATCSHCGLCWKIGHCNAISHDANGVTTVNPELCLACSTCIDICSVKAITMQEEL